MLEQDQPSQPTPNGLHLSHSSTNTSKKSSFRFSYKSSHTHSVDSMGNKDEQPNGVPKQKPVFTTSMSTDDSSASLNTISDYERDRIRKLHGIMGDSIFLVEKLRSHDLPNDPFISPLLSEECILATQ